MLFSIVASPALHAVGVSFKTISLGFGVLYIILALFEIPTGVWADLFGAKKSSIIGGVIQSLALFLFILSKNHSVIVITSLLYMELDQALFQVRYRPFFTQQQRMKKKKILIQTNIFQ